MLNSNRHFAPLKKFRGKRAYFSTVLKKADAFCCDPEGENHWWDLWHYHADWHGVGNLRWRYRLIHFTALCRVYTKIAEAFERYPRPFQTWIQLDGEDAGQDATYLHTPNPNRSQYPLQILGVQWGVHWLEDLATQYAGNRAFRAGLYRSRAEHETREHTSYIVYSPEIGDSVE